MRIVCAQREALGHDPVRDAARVPLRADVGPGPRDHPEAHLLDEFHEIFEFGKIRLPFARLVVIPEDVRLDGIEAGAFELLEPIPP